MEHPNFRLQYFLSTCLLLQAVIYNNSLPHVYPLLCCKTLTTYYNQGNNSSSYRCIPYRKPENVGARLPRIKPFNSRV